MIWLSRLVMYALVLQSTFTGAATLGSLATVEQLQNQVSVLKKRIDCCKSEIFSFNDSTMEWEATPPGGQLFRNRHVRADYVRRRQHH